MYTQLNVDVDLLAKAKQILDVKDDAKAVEVALENIVRHNKLQNLKSYYGKLDLDIDLDSLRGRTRNELKGAIN